MCFKEEALTVIKALAGVLVPGVVAPGVLVLVGGLRVCPL
jgi:hypothetical protein